MPKILANKDLLRKAEPYILPVALVLIGLTAFGLGRLSTVGEQGPRLIINAPVQTASVALSNPARTAGVQSGGFVASKSGTKYYLPSCSGVSKIKEENKVWFATVAQAQAAGYTAAANCPGL